MKILNSLWLFSLALVLVCTAGCGRRSEVVPNSKADTVFSRIIRHVEPEGEFLMVADTGRLMRNLADFMLRVEPLVAQEFDEEELAEFNRVAKEMPAFLERHGFLALRGVGLSSVPVGDGVHSTRAFALRDADKAGSPMWRMFASGAPRDMTCHAFLPEDVVAFSSGTGEIAALWELIRASVTELTPEELGKFEESIQMAGMVLGVGLEKLLESIGGEKFVALALDADKTFQIPGTKMTLPAPSLLIALSLKEPLLAELLEQNIAKGEGLAQITRSTVRGSEIISLQPILPTPFPVQLAMCHRKEAGLLLLGTSLDIVRAAVEAGVSGERRLLEAPEVLEEFGGEIKPNNGLFYVGRRLSKAVAEAAKEMASGTDEDGEVASQLLERMFMPGGFATGVMRNLPEGIEIAGRETQGAEKFLQAGLVAPAGILTAIAIPNFIRARETAQRNACQANLRLLDEVRERALLEGKANPTEADITKYFKDPLQCPKAKAPYTWRDGVPQCPSGDPEHRLP